MLNALYLLAGIALLTGGGEALIRGALGIARRLGVSPLLAGLVIVGFGTSMPELVVSLDAVLGGHPAIAVGNVVGSNIANVLLILGVCAAISPAAVTPLALRRDAVTVIAASLLYIFFTRTNALTRLDGTILLLTLATYLVWAYRSERSGAAAPAAAIHAEEAATPGHVPQSTGWSSAAVLFGLCLLIAGSRILLRGAVGIAQDLGISEAVIGLTLVAVGTSLPELSVSVIAALRRQADVAVGNVLGSNIFNLLGILGVASLVSPLEVQGRLVDFDQWVMLAVALLLFVFLYTGQRLCRLEGGLLLTAYAVYIGASFTLVGG